MAIRVNVYRQRLGRPAAGHRQIIVPVRFARARRGAPAARFPDPDDRGFDLGTSGSWRTDARGAVMGLPMGHMVNLRVVREDIDEAAPIFVTSSHRSVEIIPPDRALPASGNFQVRAGGFTLLPVKLAARLGAVDGPILGEMVVSVIGWGQVPVCCHLVTLNGTVLHDAGGAAIPAATARTRPNIEGLIADTNAMFVPFGIRFRIVEWKNTTHRLTSTGGAITAGHQGHVTISETGDWWLQSRELSGINRRARAINLYFVRGIYKLPSGIFNQTLGIGTSVTAATRYGVVLIDATDAQTLAHELGHVLHLDFHGGGGIGHSDDTPTTDHARDHIWARRRLMYSYSMISNGPAYRRNVGYGPDLAGAFLAMKNLAGDPTDAEYDEVRTRASRPLP